MTYVTKQDISNSVTDLYLFQFTTQIVQVWKDHMPLLEDLYKMFLVAHCNPGLYKVEYP